MFALGCNQIMDCGTPPVHSRSPWAACTSVDRSARDANARVHIRVGMMANVFTHTLVSFRSYFSEPCPCQTHFYDIFVLKTFIEEISWLNLSNRSSFEIPTFWLGLSASPVQVCKGMMLHVALSCTTQHGGAPSLQNVLQRCQGL